MARTPGLALLGTALRPTRRAFLRGGAGLGAALATGPLPRAFAADRSSVAIVGAGIAGLAAALALRDRGITPTVFEASSRIGGRMHSETQLWGSGVTSEYCGELIDTPHTTIQSLAKRFALALDDVNAAESPHSEPVAYFRGRYVPYAELRAAFKPVYQTLAGAACSDRAPQTYAHHTAAGVMFDRMTLFEWIERYVPGGHRSVLGRFLDVGYLDEYGRETRAQSALNLILWLGIQPDPGEFSIVGPSDNRFHIRGGNQRLPLAIVATLPPERVIANAALTAIRTLADGRVGLTFEGFPTERIFDHVIVTVPFTVLRAIDTAKAGFDERKRTAIDRLGYGANAKLIVQFKHRFWRGRGAWPGVGDGDTCTDLPYQSTWDASRAQPAPFGLLADYVGEGQRVFGAPAPYSTSIGTPLVDGYARTFAQQLEHVFPHAGSAYTGRAMLSQPYADRHAGGSYSCWLPGQYTTISGYERIRQGNIHFAGEHTSQRFQGYMEGAAETGLLAAGEVLDA